MCINLFLRLPCFACEAVGDPSRLDCCCIEFIDNPISNSSDLKDGLRQSI